MLPDFRQLIRDLTGEDPDQAAAARSVLLAAQENAVSPLADAYFAGVSDADGAILLKLIAEIGGPDAMSTLRDVFEFENGRPALKRAAARGLLHNASSLSPEEVTAVERFLTD